MFIDKLGRKLKFRNKVWETAINVDRLIIIESLRYKLIIITIVIIVKTMTKIMSTLTEYQQIDAERDE